MHREFVPFPPLFATQSRSNRTLCNVIWFGAPAGPVIVLVPTASEMRSWSAPSFSGAPGSTKLNVLQVSPAGHAASSGEPALFLPLVCQVRYLLPADARWEPRVNGWSSETPGLSTRVRLPALRTFEPSPVRVVPPQRPPSSEPVLGTTRRAPCRRL